MKSIRLKLLWAGVLLAGNCLTSEGVLTTNSWNDGSGKWELGSNWDHGVPSVANAINFVSGGFPAGPRTITIDVDTVVSNVINGCMLISNLTVSGTVLDPNTVSLNNANNTPGNTSLIVLSNLRLNNEGFLSITNSRLRVDGLPNGFGGLFVDGGAGTLYADSTLFTTNTFIGFSTTGKFSVQGGSWDSGPIWVSDQSGSQGTLTVSGGTITIFDGFVPPAFFIGANVNAIGTVWLNGGQINVTNNTTFIGFPGSGRVTISNGTFAVKDVLLSQSGGTGNVTIAGGKMVVKNFGTISVGSFSTNAAIWLTGGELNTSNGSSVFVGDVGVGQITVSNGTWIGGSQTLVGYQTGLGTLTILGGSVSTRLFTGEGIAGTGTVWMSGGQLDTSTAEAHVGGQNVGQMTVSNGSWQAREVFVGLEAGSSGTLTLVGGTNTLPTGLFVGYQGTGTVWMTGGMLITSNSPGFTGESAAGISGVGRINVSGGKWLAREVDMGVETNSEGTLTVSGGQVVATNGPSQILIGGRGWGRLNAVSGSVLAQSICVECTNGLGGELTTSGSGSIIALSNLLVGDCAADGFGVVQMNGGAIYVTNATHTAVLELRNGYFLLAGGSLVVDRLVITNACLSAFDRIGGNVNAGVLVLDPDQDADGDGLPNGWEQTHQLDPLSSIGNNGADGDPDGDGFSNWQEYQAGSDPQNPLSTPLQIVPPPFQITSIVQSGNNILLTWTTPGGTTNQVQVTPGAGGSYATNGFSNLGPQIVIGGSGAITTNYTDVGGATNKPSRFYRVRLVP